MTKKLDLGHIKDEFTKRGWTCLAEEYGGNLAPLECVCDQGHSTTITWCNFKKGQGCRYCAGNVIASFEEVKSYFSQHGCELLDKEYVNAFTSLRYRCKCGNESIIRFVEFKRGHRCKSCGAKTISDKLRVSDSDMAVFCQENNCKLLRSWIQAKRTRIEYVCGCGETSEAYWSNYFRYPNCKKCGNQKVSGDNNYMWNEDREEVARRKRFRKTCGRLISRVLKATGGKKADRSAALLGYTPEQLQEHILNHPNMASLQGKEWHVDHIFPIQAFLDHGIEDLRLINALDNLQPLEGSENISKGDGYDTEQFLKWMQHGTNLPGNAFEF